jgi:hypothetical protein
LTLEFQAAVFDGRRSDASPFGQDGFTATEVDIGRGQVADAFVMAVVVGVDCPPPARMEQFGVIA